MVTREVSEGAVPVKQYNPHHAMVEDFSRDVICLFGLVVDRSTPEKTLHWIRSNRRQDGVPAKLWATINVNWVAMSDTDLAFRRGVLLSDHCTLDGRPLVMVANRLGLRPGVVVQGSSTASWLNDVRHEGEPTTIAFFGGQDGVGERAIAKINEDSRGLKGVGALNPGFVPLETLAESDWVERLNALNADVLSVALGARKGQVWLAENVAKLNNGVVAHLGATVNFFAKEIKRAPQWVQKLALEWVWRIFQEPALFTRYWQDGLFFLKSLRTLYRRWPVLNDANVSAAGEWQGRLTDDGHWQISAPAHVGDNAVAAGRAFWPEGLTNSELSSITLDCLDCQAFTNEGLAQLLLVAKHANLRGMPFNLLNVNGQLSTQLEVSGVDASLKALGVVV